MSPCDRFLAVLALLVVAAGVFGEDAPLGVLRGIAAVETRSSIAADGTVTWVDHRRGTHGERGAFQCGAAALEDSGIPGSLDDLEKDPQFALRVARAYLVVLKRRWGTWDRAVEAYNAGHPGVAGRVYFAKVSAVGRK